MYVLPTRVMPCHLIVCSSCFSLASRLSCVVPPLCFSCLSCLWRCLWCIFRLLFRASTCLGREGADGSHGVRADDGVDSREGRVRDEGLALHAGGADDGGEFHESVGVFVQGVGWAVCHSHWRISGDGYVRLQGKVSFDLLMVGLLVGLIAGRSSGWLGGWVVGDIERWRVCSGGGMDHMVILPEAMSRGTGATARKRRYGFGLGLLVDWSFKEIVGWLVG